MDCQLDVLRRCLKLYSLRQALRSLPKSLNETYYRILLNIPEEYSRDAFAILQWLSFSSRPMTIDEVAEVVAIDLVDSRFDPNRRLGHPRNILDICSSLVTISMSEEQEGEEKGAQMSNSTMGAPRGIS